MKTATGFHLVTFARRAFVGAAMAQSSRCPRLSTNREMSDEMKLEFAAPCLTGERPSARGAHYVSSVRASRVRVDGEAHDFFGRWHSQAKQAPGRGGRTRRPWIASQAIVPARLPPISPNRLTRQL